MRMLSVDQIQGVCVNIFLCTASTSIILECLYVLHTHIYTHICVCILQQLTNISDRAYLQILNIEALLPY